MWFIDRITGAEIAKKVDEYTEIIGTILLGVRAEVQEHQNQIESQSKLIGQLNASQRRQKDYIDQLAVQVHNLEGRWQAAMRAELSRMTSGAENRIRVEVQQHLRNTSDRLQEALKQFAQQEIQDRIAAYERAIVRLRWQCWLLCLFAAMVGVVAWIIG